MSAAPVDVAVAIDLYRDAAAGGHVKVWERFAEAAVGVPGLDLTVYVLGETETETPLDTNVRFRTIPPALGTDRFPLLAQGGGHTELAGVNRRLARRLAGHRVLHATSPFGFATTAMRVARRRRLPLVTSTHTDAGKLARVYSRQILERVLGAGAIGRRLIDGLDLPGRAARSLDRRMARLMQASRLVLASSDEDRNRALEVLPAGRVTRLRRGIDTDRFSPARRDRAWLASAFGVAPEVPVVLFAGRVDETKRVLSVARAVGRLRDTGAGLRLVVAGKGSAAPEIAAILGADAVLCGAVPQPTLARLMASADVFAFPSESEVAGNVVVEAKASGLPVIVSARGNARQGLAEPGRDGIALDEVSDAALAEAIGGLLADPGRRSRMGAEARAQVEAHEPTWAEVLAEDLVPVWRAVAGLQRLSARGPRAAAGLRTR